MATGRTFEIAHPGRTLSVRVRPVDDAWELWLYENDQPLFRVDVVSVDDAASAWIKGSADPVADAVVRVRHRLAAGEIDLGR